eukprot:3938730-Alexandrium_andersonii.AAC.1
MATSPPLAAPGSPSASRRAPRSFRRRLSVDRGRATRVERGRARIRSSPRGLPSASPPCPEG